MFGEKYIEKELREKFDSMKQLDRIEFIERTNSFHNTFPPICRTLLLISFFEVLFLVMGVDSFIKAKLSFILGLETNGYLYVGMGIMLIILSLLFFVSIIIGWSKMIPKEKESMERLEKFLEEKSK